MDIEYDYDAIRPYYDSEVPDVFKRMVSEPELKPILRYVFPDKTEEEAGQLLLSLRSVYDFQCGIVAPFFEGLIEKTANGLDINGLDRVRSDMKYLFISNHRDIILDAALLNVLLLTNGKDSVQNAIGDNLCVSPWITDAMKLNKNFIVQRSGTKREIFEASKRLSAYIRYNITESKDSVWIAQREGRAKDSNDRTQESLLKMLCMSAGKNFKESFIELNIMPISISYEYDACDFLKAQEFQMKRDNPDYRKTEGDDLLNMLTGLKGYKGRIHYEIAGTINGELAENLYETDHRATVLEKTAAIIDCRIHKNYRIYPGNYVALDVLNNCERFLGEKYSLDEKAGFEKYLDGQLDKILLPDKDVPFLRGKLLEMYANPLRNHLKAIEG